MSGNPGAYQLWHQLVELDRLVQVVETLVKQRPQTLQVLSAILQTLDNLLFLLMLGIHLCCVRFQRRQLLLQTLEVCVQALVFDYQLIAMLHVLYDNNGAQVWVDEVNLWVDDLNVVGDVDPIQGLAKEGVLMSDLAGQVAPRVAKTVELLLNDFVFCKKRDIIC